MRFGFDKRDKGYTLIEVMVGAVLLSIAIVAVFQAVSHGTNMSRLDYLRRRAYLHLEQILENPRHSYKGSYYEEAVRNGEGRLAASSVLLDSVLLDDRETENVTQHLYGEARLFVDNVTTTVEIGGITNSVKCKKLKARVSWCEKGVCHAESLETLVSMVNVN